MDCPEFLSRYSDYDDSLLPPFEVERFQAHMGSCPSCARYDRVLRKGRMLARQLPELEPSGELEPRLRLRLLETAPRSRRRAGPSPARLAGALAAVTILLVVSAVAGLLGPRVSGPVAGQLAGVLSGPVPGPVPGAASESLAGVAAGPVAGAVSGPVSLVSRGLPLALGSVAPRPWPARRVDPGVASSYSPLVVGPPAYRGARPRHGSPIPVYRTLD